MKNTSQKKESSICHNLRDTRRIENQAVMVSRYFWDKWRPLLGNSLAILIMSARDRCCVGIESDGAASFFSSMDDLAQSAGLSAKQVTRLLKHPLAEKFITYKPTYIYNPEKGKKAKGKCLFEVNLHDPLVPGDEDSLKESEIFITNSPKGHFGLKTTPQSGKDSIKREQPLYNIYNNIYTTTANSDSNLIFESEDNDVQNENIVSKIRRLFNNRISKRKILQLINETSHLNVQNQMKWFQYRDNSWANNGPVAAFVTYCEQELDKPECLGKQKSRENIAFKQIQNEDSKLKYEDRRKEYAKPEQYDVHYREILKNLKVESIMGRAILKSSFIGEVRGTGSHKRAIMDIPTNFQRQWFERNCQKQFLEQLRVKFGKKASLEFIVQN